MDSESHDGHGYARVLCGATANIGYGCCATATTGCSAAGPLRAPQCGVVECNHCPGQTSMQLMHNHCCH